MIESETTVGADLRITCSKDELVQGLSTVARALSTRTAIQILSGSNIAVAGNTLVAARDQNAAIQVTQPTV